MEKGRAKENDREVGKLEREREGGKGGRGRRDDGSVLAEQLLVSQSITHLVARLYCATMPLTSLLRRL